MNDDGIDHGSSIDEVLARRAPRRQRAWAKLWGPAVIVAVIALSLWLAFWPGVRESWIERHGVAAPAKILSLHDTGSRYNDDVVVRFRVEVRPLGDGAPFKAEFTVPVSSIDAIHMQVGSPIRVKYLRSDHTWITPLSDWR